MIAKLYKKTPQIELFGKVQEFNSFSKQLLVDNADVNLEFENSELFPDIENLESIQVKHLPNDFVTISTADKSLLITGSLNNLRVLSANLENQDIGLKNYHIHIEYYDGHPYLSQDAVPLVVNFV